jgi:hypothetical protein
MGSVRERNGEADNLAEMSAMKQILDWHMEETITEEQVQRVLAPVLEMIRQGRFSKRRRMQRIRNIALWAATCVAAITVLLLTVADLHPWIEIPETEIPLAATPIAGGSLSGRVTFEGWGVSGVVLALEYAGGGSATTVTDNGGKYAFDGISRGNHRLEVELPDGMALEGGADGFLLNMTDGKALKDVEIRLCIAEN